MLTERNQGHPPINNKFYDQICQCLQGIGIEVIVDKTADRTTVMGQHGAFAVELCFVKYQLVATGISRFQVISVLVLAAENATLGTDLYYFALMACHAH